MKVLGFNRIDFDGTSTWQIKYESEYRQEVLCWLTEQGWTTKLSDRCLDENDQMRWQIIFGRLLDTLLLTRTEDAMLARLSLDQGEYFV